MFKKRLISLNNQRLKEIKLRVEEEVLTQNFHDYKCKL